MGLPWVYIAGPLTKGGTLANVHRACQVWATLIQRGDCHPVCPHWSALQEMIDTSLSYDDWLDYDFEIIERCIDVIYRLPGESTGADREAECATKHGVPVVYTYYDLDKWLKGRRA